MPRQPVPMRKESRLMRAEEDVDAFLREATVGHLGTCYGDEPYIVPVNYVYLDERIYFHSALAGKKNRNIQANPLVCFEVDEMWSQPVPPDVRRTSLDCGMAYRSVIAYGPVRLVEDRSSKRRALEALMDKYVPGGDYPPISEADIDTAAVWEIEIEEKVGKRKPNP